MDGIKRYLVVFPAPPGMKVAPDDIRYHGRRVIPAHEFFPAAVSFENLEVPVPVGINVPTLVRCQSFQGIRVEKDTLFIPGITAVAVKLLYLFAFKAYVFGLCVYKPEPFLAPVFKPCKGFPVIFPRKVGNAAGIGEVLDITAFPVRNEKTGFTTRLESIRFPPVQKEKFFPVGGKICMVYPGERNPGVFFFSHFKKLCQGYYQAVPAGIQVYKVYAVFPRPPFVFKNIGYPFVPVAGTPPCQPGKIYAQRVIPVPCYRAYGTPISLILPPLISLITLINCPFFLAL